jgi:hypothetical protein
MQAAAKEGPYFFEAIRTKAISRLKDGKVDNDEM